MPEQQQEVKLSQKLISESECHCTKRDPVRNMMVMRLRKDMHKIWLLLPSGLYYSTELRGKKQLLLWLI